PAESAVARLYAQEDRELRPLDRRHGEDPGEDAGSLREVTGGDVCYLRVIARAAKQSTSRRGDRWIASSLSLLAMTRRELRVIPSARRAVAPPNPPSPRSS